MVCREHARTTFGREMQAVVARAARDAVRMMEETEGRGTAARVFRRRIERGDYAELFDTGLRRVIEQAALVEGVSEEIGALRVMLARLLAEEEDPVRQATAVARLAQASVRTVRLQREITGGSGDPLIDQVLQTLAELDGESG